VPRRPGGVRHDVRSCSGHRVQARVLLGGDVVVLSGRTVVLGGHEGARRNSVRHRWTRVQRRKLHVSCGHLFPLWDVPKLHGPLRVIVSLALDS
jgi:hypothetical protein